MNRLEAGIDVTLRVDHGAIAGVRIHSTRLVQAPCLLAGRSPAQVIAILPTLYALCGTAQALAGCSAMETALGLSPSPAQRMARRVLLRLETVTEHAQGILRDWPALLGEQPDPARIKPLRPMLTAAKRALYPGGDWARPGGGMLAIDRGALVEQMRRVTAMVVHLLDSSPEDWAENLTTIQSWMRHGEGVAARLIRRIDQGGLAGFGRAARHLMPEGGPRDLEARLAADTSGAYVARPDGPGPVGAYTVLETNALSRQIGQPLVAGLMVLHGTGLTTRFIARLVEITEALRELGDLVQDLCDDPAEAAEPSGSGSGLGVVDAARGLLAHRVEIEEGMVSRYQILAPTEWNFHPQGPLHAGLMGAEAGPDPEGRARLLVAALDPCVACSVRVETHA